MHQFHQYAAAIHLMLKICADRCEQVLHAGQLSHVLLDLADHLIGAFKRRAWRGAHGDFEFALIGVRQKALADLHEERSG